MRAVNQPADHDREPNRIKTKRHSHSLPGSLPAAYRFAHQLAAALCRIAHFSAAVTLRPRPVSLTILHPGCAFRALNVSLISPGRSILISFSGHKIAYSPFTSLLLPGRGPANQHTSGGSRGLGKRFLEVLVHLNLTDPKLIAFMAGGVLLLAVVAWLYLRKRRATTANLRRRFGAEYERVALEHGSERKAEAKLADREKRVESFKLRDLDPTERERFLQQWAALQSRFVDSPKGAVAEADDLVSSLMKTRGYPVTDFDQRADDISVDHPRVVENYRSAHVLALRIGKDQASTEDLRTAMIHYRSLFDELAQLPVERKEVA
jgi:hypothetical protein